MHSDNHRAYLFRAVTHEAANHRRALSRRRLREASAVAASSGSAEYARDVEALLVLARLTTRQRTVIWLAYWLDASVNEITEISGLSRRTVERELCAARLILAKELR